jgi:lipopolysaccharide biosynthesis regulator YciM
VTLDPQVQRRLLAASGFSELGLFQEAVEELEGLPAEVRETRSVLTVWLELYQVWQKWAEAAAVATRLVEAEPEESNWPVALAYATRRSYGLASARDILISASRKFPNCAMIQFNLACYDAQLGHLSEARKRLRQAIRIDQDFADLARTDPDLEPIRDEVE